MSDPVDGIDVSLFNRITGHTLRGLDFVFAKASQRTFRDPKYQSHLQLIQDEGLIAGAYHYATPTPNGASQAKAFLSWADNAAMLALDFEGPVLNVPKVGRDFIAEVKRWDNRPIVLYSSEGTWPGNFGQDANWVANWSHQPAMPWLFWQYSGSGLDRDRFNGTLAQLHAFVARETPPQIDGGDAMFNVAPMTTHRDAIVKDGAVLYRDSALTDRYSVATGDTPLGFAGSGTGFHVVINSGNTNYVHREDVLRIETHDRTYV